MTGPSTVGAYIAAQEPHVAAILEELRRTIHAAVPGVAEEVKYSMPAFQLVGAMPLFTSNRIADLHGYWQTEVLTR